MSAQGNSYQEDDVSQNQFDRASRASVASPEELIRYNWPSNLPNAPPRRSRQRATVESESSGESTTSTGSASWSDGDDGPLSCRWKGIYSPDIGIDILPPSTSSLSLHTIHDPNGSRMLVPNYGPRMSFSADQDTSDPYSEPQPQVRTRSHRYRPGAHDGWTQCARALREHDDIVVNAWKEGIDTLLVFAGLFSAVLTAFNIESYTLLQQDPAQSAVILLSQISAQLDNPSVSTSFGSTTVTGRFRASATAVIINVLWFSSLVFSLVSASLAILVKQWLQEYTSGISSQPRERTRIRQYRYDGLVRWKVDSIIMLLPLLLQIALILFFAGLLVLLWSLHPVVAGMVTVLISTWIAFWLFTIVMPTMHVDCPYKSSEAWGFFGFIQSARRLYVIAAAYSRQMWRNSVRSTFRLATFLEGAGQTINMIRQSAVQPYYSSWREREKLHVSEASTKLDLHTLTGADEALLDDSLLDSIVRPCLYDLPLDDGVECLLKLLTRRGNCTVDTIKDWMPNGKDKGIPPLIYVAVDILAKIDSQPRRRNEHPHLLTVLSVIENYLRVTEADISEGLCVYMLEVLPCFLDEKLSAESSHKAMAALSLIFSNSKYMDLIAQKQMLQYAAQLFELAEWDRQASYFLNTSILTLRFITHNPQTGIAHSLQLTRLLGELEAFFGALATDTLAGADVRPDGALASGLFQAVRDFARVLPGQLHRSWVATLLRLYERAVADPRAPRAHQAMRELAPRMAMKELCELYGLDCPDFRVPSPSEAGLSGGGSVDGDSEAGTAPQVVESPLATDNQTMFSDELHAPSVHSQ